MTNQQKTEVAALLDEDYVHHVVVTPELIRNYFDGNANQKQWEEVEGVLDEAQGEVFSDATEVSYVVIEVRR